jgi:hypothetical protein
MILHRCQIFYQYIQNTNVYSSKWKKTGDIHDCNSKWGGGEKNSEVSGFFSILKQFLFSILNYSQDILKFFRLLWIHVPFVILYVFYCLNPVTTIYTIYSPPLPPLELERILDCIIFINTVKPVLCDLSREQSNMVT